MSFELTEGVTGLLGANGAGKTTLMRMMSGILTPTGGEITADGIPVNTENYRALLGYLPQDFGYYPEFSAREFLEYMGALKGIKKKKAREKSSELLELVGLSDVARKKIKTYSGGMKQRVLIAAAMLGDPDLLILDEPTAGLDPKQRVIIRNMVSELGQDKIIIISTHIVSDIETIAKEILFIKEGHLIDSGSIPYLVEKVTDGEKSLENLYMQYYGEVQR